jgi:predicted RNA-binding protein (virulence factor B family)
MIKIGHHHNLTILRDTSVGLYLGDEDGDEVLLPNKYCPEIFEIGDSIKVFVYLDYMERKIATNLQPKVLMNQFAYLEVSAISEIGIFMDWGLEKHLLVPFRERKQDMEEGRHYMVFMTLDEDTNRLYGSNRIERHLSNENLSVEEGQKVDLLIWKRTDIGYVVIINHLHKGLVYKNEVYKDIHIGQHLEGYIKKIREDNKIDVSLQPIGYTNAIDPHTTLIYKKLESAGGFIPLNDKSSPEEIYNTFSMSKKAFKKAIGSLYKERKIKIDTSGITMIQPEN